MAPKLANSQLSADFQACGGLEALQNGDFDRFSGYQSGCSPLKYCGSSYLIRSGYFLLYGAVERSALEKKLSPGTPGTPRR
jgi:hypothetical protein